ncbi:MAG: nucleotide exchange factor GrpE [Solirubrobacteraceae bacterium]
MSDAEQILQEEQLEPQAKPPGREGGIRSPQAPEAGAGAVAPGTPSAEAPAEESPATGPPGPAREPEDGDGAREVAGDLDALVATAAQRDEYLALAQRTQADFENYRKRVARESAAAAERGVAKLAKELLPALDNLDRALGAAEEQDPLLEGVRLVRAELAAALARVGIESFDPAGEQFDPTHHEAMAQQPVEGAESGTVVEVYQSGYRLNGTVIRPARVVVAA